MNDESSLIHRAYRHIDRPIHIAGLPIAHWAMLLTAAGVAFGLSKLLPFSSTYRLSIAVTIVGTPAALVLATAGQEARPLSIVAAAIRWQLGRKRFPAATALRPDAPDKRRRRRSAGEGGLRPSR